MRERFGQLADGTAVDVIRLRGGGLEMDVLTYGCIIQALRVPDRKGRLADVVLGFDTLQEYVARSPYFGAVVGRYANRIANARFVLDGKEHQLAANEPPHHLHGGYHGFDKAVWSANASSAGNGVVFRHTSPNGDENYPGTLQLEVSYTLDAGSVRIDYFATSDAPTVINLTQHSYFNLRGEGDGDIRDHHLCIDADFYTPVDARLIPTGEIAPVAGSRFDFRKSRPIGGEYDHNFVLRRVGYAGDLLTAAELSEPASGRALHVLTTEPGLQVYTGHGLDGTLRGKSGRPYIRQAAVCLETQHFPDSPNRPAFPSPVLRPDGRYESRTVFRFDAR